MKTNNLIFDLKPKYLLLFNNNIFTIYKNITKSCRDYRQIHTTKLIRSLNRLLNH